LVSPGKSIESAFDVSAGIPQIELDKGHKLVVPMKCPFADYLLVRDEVGTPLGHIL
jgi:hypothetical protein